MDEYKYIPWDLHHIDVYRNNQYIGNVFEKASMIPYFKWIGNSLYVIGAGNYYDLPIRIFPERYDQVNNDVGEGGTCPTGYSPFTSDMSSGKVKTVPETNTIPCQVISKTTPIRTCVSNGCNITV